MSETGSMIGKVVPWLLLVVAIYFWHRQGRSKTPHAKDILRNSERDNCENNNGENDNCESNNPESDGSKQDTSPK